MQPFNSPKFDLRGATRYVIRCVYQRPQCGPLHPDVVSRSLATPFGIATFFDLDAPARPITISLPIDTSIAGLRKLAEERQLPHLEPAARADGARQGLQEGAADGTFGSSGEFDLGMICSFSIPIITICALIVLMIFLSLLNIVFWWMPFLKHLLPDPGLQGQPE